MSQPAKPLAIAIVYLLGVMVVSLFVRSPACPVQSVALLFVVLGTTIRFLLLTWSRERFLIALLMSELWLR